jgi:hypothetical protein
MIKVRMRCGIERAYKVSFGTPEGKTTLSVDRHK